MASAGEPLPGDAVLAEVISAETAMLGRRRQPRWLDGTAFGEVTTRITGRFADGEFIDCGSSIDAGISVRVHTAEGIRYETRDGLRSDPDKDVADGQRAAPRIPAAFPAESLPLGPIMATLAAIDTAARAHDPSVAQVLIDFEIANRRICIGSLDSPLVQDHRQLVYLTIRVVARLRDRMATGFYTPGLAGTLDALDPAAIGAESAARAVTALDARPAPAGHFPVVVAGGRGIVLLHEACCHPLEGDEVSKGSVYGRQLGGTIASEIVSIVDDGTLGGAVGTSSFDDEGLPTRPTPLVTDGRLTSFLTDRQTARDIGHPRTGNARCQSYRSPPLPRMTNTRLVAGTARADDIIGDTRFGLYAQHVAGGEVVESTGDFVFRVTNGYWIQDGKIGQPVTETTVAGNGAEVLRQIDAVADDTRVGAARCGKFGQFIPVGVAGPTLRVRSLLVGGSSGSR
jgi:TldD protein